MKYKLVSSILLLVLIVPAQAAIHIPPSIRDRPDDLTYELGTTGHTLSWTAEAAESGDSPTVYFVYKDGVVLGDHDGVSWSDNVPVEVNVSGLALGEYIYQIEFRDNGYPDQADASFDSATVTVVEELTSSESTSESSSDSSTSDTSEDSNPASLEFNLILGIFSLVLVIPVIRRQLR